MKAPPTVRVHKDDHPSVIAYYKARRLEVKCEHDPMVRWPVVEQAPREFDRYRELED